MTTRRKIVDKEAAKQLRAELYDAISRGELTLQDTVKIMRKISRLTQEQFAAHRGVSSKVIKEIERGAGNPTVNSLNRIGEFFGLEVAFVRSETLRSHENGVAGELSSRVPYPESSKATVAADVQRLVDDLRRAKNVTLSTSTLQELLKQLSPEQQALDEARQFIDAAEQLKRQLEPSQEVRKWLADVEAAKQLLNPAHGDIARQRLKHRG